MKAGGWRSVRYGWVGTQRHRQSDVLRSWVSNHQPRVAKSSGLVRADDPAVMRENSLL